MALEDRDRSFDKALSRHLRSNIGSGAAADLRPNGAASPDCLDPEMLAAYHERSLLPEEMNAAKEHIVGCARCQSILASLEITDGIPLAPVASEKESVLAAAAPKTRAPIPIRGPRWAWLVPAGALAAGLLVWVGLHENRKNTLLGRGSEVKMAKAQEPAPPLPMATRQAPAAPTTDQLSDSGAAGGVVNDRARAVENLKQFEAPAPRAKVAPAMPSAGIAGAGKELRKDAARDSSVAQHLADKADLDDKREAAGQLSEQAQLQNQAASIQVQNAVVAPKVAGPGPLNQATPSKKAKTEADYMYRAAAAPPQAPAAQSTPVAGFASSTVETVANANPRLISAPGTSLIWLAGRAGLIEFSGDNGATWARQTSGVLTDLTTGAAPAPNVCWIVGRVGTILLTVDGGAHWSLVHSPVSEDLGGIRAVDALHATIWNVRNTKSFETADGGVTWKPVPAP